MVTPRLDVTYQSRIYFATYNNVAGPTPGTFAPPTLGTDGYQKGYALLNGRLTWDAPDRDWSVSLYGNNLTDYNYFYGKLSLVALLSREQGNPAPGRTWGLTVKRTF